MRNATTQRRARKLRNDATDAERHLWHYLRRRQLSGHRFRRQVPVSGFVADFACIDAKLIIELDGGQHQDREMQDVRRDKIIEAQGFRILRFWNNDVFLNTGGVLAAIVDALNELCPHPALPPQAEEGN